VRNVVVNVIAAAYVLPVSWRVKIMRLAGVTIGDGTDIKSRCTFAGPGPVTIGSGCYISFQCAFDATGPIDVGDNVYIAARANIGTCTHDIGSAEKRAGRQYPDGVSIGNGTWVGTGCVILPGVRIGSGCVIAAGAVVIDDCDPDGLYAGVPAKLVHALDAEPVAA
jgi:acetyltransferase-like isoleucine patch superfamily enzyme